MGFFSNMRNRMKSSDEYEEMGKEDEGYVELDTDVEESRSKVIVRPFVIEDFEDLKPILDTLRGGNTIALVNIKPLKDKDMVELKRAINKLKKTTDALDAGLKTAWLCVTSTAGTIANSRSTTSPTSTSAGGPSTDTGSW